MGADRIFLCLGRRPRAAHSLLRFRSVLSGASLGAALFVLGGCSGGLSASTRDMRRQLDAGRVAPAVAALDRQLHVTRGALPKTIEGDDAILVLDRAMLQHARGRYAESKRDYEAADKALDILDLSRNAGDRVARATVSDSAGRYAAPPHEKILLNVFNMLNYLVLHDPRGAEVEARRMLVWSRFLHERDRTTHPAFGFGSYLAGFSFEKADDHDEARRFYDDAKRIAPHLPAPTAVTAATVEADAVAPPTTGETAPKAGAPATGELLVVVGYGRVPHREAERLPIGLALTRSAALMPAASRNEATQLAAQGLVTWVNYPRLTDDRPIREPIATLDGTAFPLAVAVDVRALVRSHWARIEPEEMATAIARAVTRYAAGQAAEAIGRASSKKHGAGIGALASLIVQASLAAADTPDTRSWETLPSRVAFARLRVPAGEHLVRVHAQGLREERLVRMAAGDWAVASFLALR